MLRKILIVFTLVLIASGIYFKDAVIEHIQHIQRIWNPASSITKQAIIVVNMQRVRNESEPFKHLSTFIEKRYTESNQQILNLESDLRQEYKKLRADEKLAQEDHDTLLQRKEDFDRRVSEIEEMVMRKKSDLNNVYLGEKEKIERLLQNIINDIAREHGASIVLNTSLGEDVLIVLFRSDALDVTDRVIKSLNNNATHLDLLKD